MNRVTKMGLVLAALTVVSGAVVATPAQAYPHYRGWARHEARVWRHERCMAAQAGYYAPVAYSYAAAPAPVPVWTGAGYVY